ncbi:penicillin-binding protein [Bifidobacterium dolichotidis]|uniref:Penicillin-binding protein n=1 Tax=Bifidobacterium dolichotidis TaxID=2306976 RepID=A0A430FQN2_9BIFI|nr:transglycosylase domain-containing protein [Bifidobacterium dolichotidis]RSX55149.1 penicillin-binding protein [Bifidobacterium dolichotidis]
MASQTRKASSSANSNSPRSARSARSASSRSTSSNASSRSTRSANSARTSSQRPQNSGPRRKAPNQHSKDTNRKRKGLWWKIPVGIIGALLVAGLAVFAYLYATTSIPQPDKIALAEKTTVYYSDGTTKIGSYADQNREIIDCSVLPDYVGKAIVASEDRSFYTNKGIDPIGITRALINNLSGGARQGGSTITQQYAERYYLGETTSYAGKAKEAVLALKINNSQNKDEILCNYMNTIYLGRGAYGIQAAAQAYFGKDAKDLTLPEAATIAGIIPAPSSWNPGVNPDKAKERFDRVIRIMTEDGYITKQQAADAKFPEVVPESQNNMFAGQNGYLLSTVQKELLDSKAFTKEELETGGYSIITTLDKDMQSRMTEVGDARPEGMPDSIQIGGIAVDQKTGEVRAMYGGHDYLQKALNNATQATFQPGSTMKPFGLIGAAQSDVSFATLFNGNSPVRFETTPGVYAEVPNALNVSYGNINLNQATANSVNTVFMNVNQNLTPERYAKIVADAGIKSKIDPNTLYNILGINSITVWDLAQGHSTIAANGMKTKLHVVSKVTKDGKDMYRPNVQSTKVFDENDCALTQHAMLGTTTNGTAAGISQALGRQVAGKSGTANDETAASFVGYTPQLMNVWAIWNPGADGSNQVVPEFAGFGVGSTGYPAHLFKEFMSTAVANMPVEQFNTPIDNGKIGGPDGKWGIMGQYQGGNQKGNQQNQPEQKEEDKDKKESPSTESTSPQNSPSQSPQQPVEPVNPPSPTQPTPTDTPTTPTPTQSPSSQQEKGQTDSEQK